MMRTGYVRCASCHTDPSGGGLLTTEGRERSERLLRTRYPSIEDPEETRPGGLLFGLVELPDEVRLGGDLRYLYLGMRAQGDEYRDRHFLMRADLMADVLVRGFRIAGSIGFAEEGARGARITSRDLNNLVSREHWVGYQFDEDGELLVRIGRMNLPFGTREIEHTAFIRSMTRVQINDAQQHGLALAWAGSGWRGEAMLIAGNFQVSPDDYREHGYSAYAEFLSLIPRTAIGVSSLMAWSDIDLVLRLDNHRAAHGIFLRSNPVKPLVAQLEVDLLVDRPLGIEQEIGHATFLKLDYEPLRGLHVHGIGETRNFHSDNFISWGAWAGATWFFAPHADLRLDVVRHSLAGPTSRLGMTSVLAQIHVFL